MHAIIAIYIIWMPSADVTGSHTHAHTQGHRARYITFAFAFILCIWGLDVEDTSICQHETIGSRKICVCTRCVCSFWLFGICEFNYDQVFLAFASKCNDDTAQCLLHACFVYSMRTYAASQQRNRCKPYNLVCGAALWLSKEFIFLSLKCASLYLHKTYSYDLLNARTNWFHLKNS